MENMPRYIIRASFSQERMTYIPEESKVIYQAKDGKREETFDALERPRQKAAGCKHLLLCAHTFPKKESKWCAITDITAMSSGAEEKTKTKMNGCPVSLKQMNLQRNIERTGHNCSKESMRLIPSRAQNVLEK